MGSPTHPAARIHAPALDRSAVEDLRQRLRRARQCQPRCRARRDPRPARAQRGRQDHADRHRLRHRRRQRRSRHRRRPRCRRRLSPDPRDDRPGSAGAGHRFLRDGLEHRVLQSRPVRPGAEPGAHRTSPARAVALGREGQTHHDPVRRHEALGADRQGLVARTFGALPRRAERRRRRGASQGHVGGGARAARCRHDHHPHHPLHRGSRGDGRPGGGHQPGAHPSRRGEARADAPAGPQAARRRAGAAAVHLAVDARQLRAAAGRRRHEARLRLRPQARRERDSGPARRARRGRSRVSRPAHRPELARGHLRRPGRRNPDGNIMNWHGIRAIYWFEMARMKRTLFQSIVSPVLSTSLYFVVFGSAIGSRIPEVDGVGYGAFIVPGLIMMSLLTQSVSNASFAIFFPKFSGTIYELLSAPVSPLELIIGYVGAASTKSVFIGVIILLTASLLVDLRIAHPVWIVLFLLLTAISFSLLGFIIGIWADNFEKLQLVPLLIITPLAFLGGTFYSIQMLTPFWQAVSLANPVLYLVSGFRWAFF